MGMAHLRAALNIGLIPVAICDLNQDRLSDAASEAGVDKADCFTDPANLFATHPNVDLVLIATTADSHRTLVELAADSGARAILCEKPMATSVADCDAMIAACSRSKTILAINHQMRFMDQYTLIKGEIDSGRFGSIGTMSVVAGCFGLSMNGSHYCEAFQWLVGREIVSASAWFSSCNLSNPRGANFFDKSGEIRFESSDGHRLIISAGHDHGHGMTVTYATRYGHIFVDELEGVYIASARKSEYKTMPVTRYGMPWDRWEVRFPVADNLNSTQAVINALLSGCDFPDAHAGRGVVAALVAAWRSAENGGLVVRVNEIGDYEKRSFPWA